MHLIKVVYGNDKGGVFSCETQYLEMLRKRGIIVHLIIVGDGVNVGKYESIVEDVIRLKNIRIKFDGGGFKRLITLMKALLFGLKNALRIRGHYKGNKISGIIYRREAFMFLGGFLAVLLRTKCYWHMANSINNRSTRLLHNAICRVLRIEPVANSEYTRKAFGPRCKHVIYPGFSIDKLNLPFNNDRFNLPIPFGVPVYGMIARISLEKAQDLLVEGFVLSRAAVEGCHLVLAGNADRPELIPELKARAGTLWGTQVHYIGLTADVAKFYGLIDVALNSRRNAEPFGISIAEAMYMKKPIVSYYLGGPSEMIIHAKNGWLVHGISAQAYCDAFDQSYENRDQWAKMGEASFKMSPPFNSQTNVDKFVSIIKSSVS